jgi:hypothetical protein
MAYTINHYNGTPVTTVADGTVDSSLPIKLIGKNYAGYGQLQNENFVYLLENFASANSPPNPATGQIWFDSGTSKLKFYDNQGKWRTTGGAEIGLSAPSGLTQGDFWFDTSTNQLKAWNGTDFTLIGPQAVKGSSTTQMLSTSVKDSFGGSHTVIEAIDNGQTIFIISPDAAFTLDNTQNSITGFSTIQQGVTLCYTNNSGTPGVTTSAHRFWGTATNSDRLGGLPASNFVQTGSAGFSSVVNFADVGYTVGNPVTRLRVFNDNASTPVIRNESNDTIKFQTTVSSQVQTPLQLSGLNVIPGTTGVSSLGTSSALWSDVWATTFHGIATQADSLSVGGVYRTASVSSSNNTIVVRDSSGAVNASVFNGASTTSFYADLAEKYLPDQDYAPGTVVKIGGDAEITTAGSQDFAIGVISTAPGYMMNSELKGGVYVALKGRVPVLCQGPISKGDQIVPFSTGFGIADNSAVSNGNRTFAIAIGSTDSLGIELVECIIL